MIDECASSVKSANILGPKRPASTLGILTKGRSTRAAQRQSIIPNTTSAASKSVHPDGRVLSVPTERIRYMHQESETAHFEVVDTGGEPMLLISGRAQSKALWNPLIDDFARHWAAVTFDHPGTGSTPLRDCDDLSTRRMARVAASVIAASPFASVHVFGYSMGGRVAQWLALDFPHLVRSLTLCATSLRGGGLLSSRGATLGDLFTPEWIDSHKELAATAVECMPSDSRVLAAHSHASARHDTSDVIWRIRIPTLVVHGTDDTVTPPDHAIEIGRAISGATLRLIVGGLHGMLYERCDEILEAVNSFTKRKP